MSDFGFLSVVPRVCLSVYVAAACPCLTRHNRSVNATTRDFEPSVTNMTFARLVLAATTNELLPMPSSEVVLPAREVAIDTIQHYMKHVYPILPSFSETSLLNTLNDVYNGDDRVVSDSDRWMLLLVLAVGSSSRSTKVNDAFYTAGTEYVAHALPYADRALAPGYPSQIQCLLLLTQYAMLDPAHFDSWLLIGFASRAVVDLGFHQDLPPKAAPDKATLDMRRRIFYCVYALDRFVLWRWVISRHVTSFVTKLTRTCLQSHQHGARSRVFLHRQRRQHRLSSVVALVIIPGGEVSAAWAARPAARRSGPVALPAAPRPVPLVPGPLSVAARRDPRPTELYLAYVPRHGRMERPPAQHAAASSPRTV